MIQCINTNPILPAIIYYLLHVHHKHEQLVFCCSISHEFYTPHSTRIHHRTIKLHVFVYLMIFEQSLVIVTAGQFYHLYTSCIRKVCKDKNIICMRRTRMIAQIFPPFSKSISPPMCKILCVLTMDQDEIVVYTIRWNVESRHALNFILYRVFLYTFSQENGKMLMLSKTRETYILAKDI